MNLTLIYPAMIGKPAFQAISQPADFTVRGNTSRGIFLSVADQRIIFLSREMYKGPLSINIPRMHPVLDEIPLQATGKVENGVIQFDATLVEIDCSQLEPWSALSTWPPIDPPWMNVSGGQISEFLRTVLGYAENELVVGVLGEIEGRDHTVSAGSADETRVQVHRLAGGLRHRDPASIEGAARFFAGRGRGLTPSGDDLLLGIVYAIFMLREKLSPE